MSDVEGASTLLIRRAELFGGDCADLRIADGRIAALAPDLAPIPGEPVIDAGGGLLLPGLQDHHMHLFATAAARSSLHCGPPAVNDERALATALQTCAGGADDWIRGVGFHQSVCGEMDRRWLDRVCPQRPVRIQHRSGMLWVLNSAAIQRLQLAPGETLPEGVEREADGTLTGRFYHLDAWLAPRLGGAAPSLAPLSRELARSGITGVTDTGARNGRSAWEALRTACERGDLRQRLLVMGTEDLHDPVDGQSEQASIGPLKIYLREDALPELDALVERVSASHRANRSVAVHCVTRTELVFMLAALEAAGVRKGDRIEHAAVADDHTLTNMARLGVTAVTQPHFIAERGDQYLAEVAAEDIPLLYRGAGFIDAGVTLAAGSDAPYGDIDPWAAMRAAVQRRTAAGGVIGDDESLTPEQALGLFGGDALRPGGGLRTLAVGQPADLCLLTIPWAQLRGDLHRRHVNMTCCGGQILYRRAAERPER